MTKEQLYVKWLMTPDLISDLDAVIATEIAKVQEAQPQPIELKGNCSTFDMSRLVDQEYKPTDQFVKCICTNSLQVENCIRNCGHGEEPEKETVEPTKQPAINPIEQAYERGEKIRRKNWPQENWIQKLSETESTSDTLTTFDNIWDFATHPELWELYTEPTEQPNSQVKLDNSFDKERFEAMFRAVYQSTTSNFDKCIEYTKENLNKLDAYYATKEGGNNE